MLSSKYANINQPVEGMNEELIKKLKDLRVNFTKIDKIMDDEEGLRAIFFTEEELKKFMNL